MRLTKIGIIGGTGFVGQNMLQAYSNQDFQCFTCSRRTGVDATNTKQVTDWIKDNQIDTVINLAAECGGIGLNKEKPADLWAAATQISSAVLLACLETNSTLVQVGTVCSYAKHCPVPFRESDLMHHGEPEETNMAYGIAKLNGLYGGQAFAKQYGLRVYNLIPVNMYGPFDHFEPDRSHVIPALIKKIDNAIKTNSNLVLWGSGMATREFLHARDFAQAVLNVLTFADSSDFFNVGTGQEISIKKLAETISLLMGYNKPIIWDSDMPDGQPKRRLDITKAQEQLAFSPKISLVDGLEEVIAWYYNQ